MRLLGCIFVFIFSAAGIHAQFKTPAGKMLFAGTPDKKLFLAPGIFVLQSLYAPVFKNNICIKTELPKPAFFCRMEDRFRDRFHIFLKLRAGNDESYMNMIKTREK